MFENFNIEKFDKDFNRFVARLSSINYELSKKSLEKERHNKKRLILEAIYIKERKPTLNDKDELERTLKLFEAYQQLSQK